MIVSFAHRISAVLVLGAFLVSGLFAAADTRRARPLLHDKVKGFSCTVSVSRTTTAVKQNSTTQESFVCNYKCFEDFTLKCEAEGENCRSLVALHWSARRYDLSGKGKGSFIGLDTDRVMHGAVDRVTGALSYSINDTHSFQSDPIFTELTEASGECEPDPRYRPVKRKPSPETKRKREPAWGE